MMTEAEHLLDLEGAIDLHFHPAPCIFPRIATDREIAQSASDRGMGGLLLKCHHESTVSRASALAPDFPDMKIYGGIVLNSYVGGINPKAVQAAIKMGAKEIWLPTIDAAFHASMHGSTGKYDVQTSGEENITDLGISVVEDGKLIPAMRTICEMIAEANIILGTCHQSYAELKVIIESARSLGVEKILLTHPFFKVPGLTLEQTMELVKLGAIAEFGYCTVSPMWAYADITRVAEAIRALGADNCVLISDAGQRHNPMPPEALRVFAQSLFEAGIREEEISIMVRSNPAWLLGLAAKSGVIYQNDRTAD